MTIVSSALVFTDGNSFVTDGHKRRAVVDPGAGIVIIDAIALPMQRQMGVSAEDAVNPSSFGVGQGAGGYLSGKPQAACVEAIQIAGEALVADVELLNAAEEQLSAAAEQFVVQRETVELVAVNGQVPQPVEGPDVTLEDGNSHKVGHHLGEAFVMIAFHPDDLDVAFAIGEFSDAGEEFPMIAVEPCEVEVGEDVAQENQTTESARLEQRNGVSSPADI